MLKTLFGAIFSTSIREAWALRYESYGWVRKTLILLLITVLTAAAIVMEFVAFAMFKENVVLAIILCIIFIALGVVAFRLSLFFSGLALRMALRGTVQEGLFAKKVKKVDNQPQTETENKTNEESENNQTENTKTEDENANLVIKTEDDVVIENGKVKYKTKALDVVIGILGFVYAIGVVATLVVVLLKNIEALKK